MRHTLLVLILVGCGSDPGDPPGVVRVYYEGGISETPSICQDSVSAGAIDIALADSPPLIDGADRGCAELEWSSDRWRLACVYSPAGIDTTYTFAFRSNWEAGVLTYERAGCVLSHNLTVEVLE